MLASLVRLRDDDWCHVRDQETGFSYSVSTLRMLYKSAGGVIASIFYLHWSLLYNRNQFALKFNSAPGKHSPRQSPSIQVAASCAQRHHCTGISSWIKMFGGNLRAILVFRELFFIGPKRAKNDSFFYCLKLLVFAKWIWWPLRRVAYE